jgi:ribonuclease HI
LIEIFIDGSCRPINPGGIATYGYVFRGDRTEKRSGFVGKGKEMSNNVAEYVALGEVLKFLEQIGAQEKDIIIYSDSNLLTNQMSNKWKARKGLYIPYWQVAKRLSIKFSKLVFKWIPREQNTEADQLAIKAYENYCRTNPRVEHV